MHAKPSAIAERLGRALVAASSYSDAIDVGATEGRCPCQVGANYLLATTMGAIRPNEHTGDSDYAEWLLRFFQPRTGCVQLVVQKGGNNVDFGALIATFSSQLDEFLAKSRSDARVVILNWHLRFTGRPNSYTGRGGTSTVFASLREVCKRYGKTLVIVYTVHEYTASTAKALTEASAVIALNRDVLKQLQALQLPGVRVACSRVPNLMITYQSQTGDLIRGYLRDSGTSDDAVRYGLACVTFLLRQAASSLARTVPCSYRGLLIFGTFEKRHGLTPENVRALSSAIQSSANLADFSVVLAGRCTNRDLLQELKTVAQEFGDRLVVLGEIDSLNELPLLRYALSYDPQGFRDNASAQVNAVRAGHLLILRRPNETDADLTQRAVRLMAACEADPGVAGRYVRLLAEQQRLAERMDANLVGYDLHRTFNEIGRSATATDTLMPAAQEIETPAAVAASAASPALKSRGTARTRDSLEDEPETGAQKKKRGNQQDG